MHLVIDQMMQFQDVHVADGDLTLERLARAAVVQRHLRRFRHASQGEHSLDFRLFGAVENRRRKRHTGFEVAGQSDDFFVVELAEIFRFAGAVVNFLEECAHFGRCRLPA